MIENGYTKRDLNNSSLQSEIPRNRYKRAGEMTLTVLCGLSLGVLGMDTMTKASKEDEPSNKSFNTGAETVYVLPPPDGEPDFPMLSLETEHAAQYAGVLNENQHVWCEDMPIVNGIQTGGRVYSGEYKGQKITNGYVHINSVVCQSYIDSVQDINTDALMSNNEIEAHIIFEHEAGHLNDIFATESTVQCYALQRAALRLIELGLTEQEVQYLRGGALSMHERTGKEYQSEECHIGGKLDISPGILYNAESDAWLP